MSYATTPGTIAHRVVELLNGMPPGTQLTAGQIGEALDVEPANLRPFLLTPIRYGVLAATPNPEDKRRMLYSLADGAATQEPDAEDKEPLSPPVNGKPSAPASVFDLGAAAALGASFSVPVTAEPRKRARKPKDEAPSAGGPASTNPATILAEMLRARGEEVDAEWLARAEALCDAPADVIHCAPGYASLADVLNRAFAQAATGKGAERHAQGQPFARQPMQDLIRLYGVGFALGQAAKKSQESMRLPTKERKVAELLGAIVYISGAIISIEQDE